MNSLKYRGYIGSVEFDIDGGYLHGKILFIDDCIIYDANTVPELQKSFENAVDDYLELCKEIGKSPEKSCSGTFNVRITPELHRQCIKIAHLKGINLNGLVFLALEQYCKSNGVIDKLSEVTTALDILNDSLEYHFSSESIARIKSMVSYTLPHEFYQSSNTGRYC